MRLEDKDAMDSRVAVERLDDGWTLRLDGVASGYWATYTDAVEEAESLRRDVEELEKRIARRGRRRRRGARLVDSYAGVVRAESRADRDYTYWLMRKRGVSLPDVAGFTRQ